MDLPEFEDSKFIMNVKQHTLKNFKISNQVLTYLNFNAIYITKESIYYILNMYSNTII